MRPKTFQMDQSLFSSSWLLSLLSSCWQSSRGIKNRLQLWRERDRETERQRNRETEIQRDRETERQRDRETERQRDRETER